MVRLVILLIRLTYRTGRRIGLAKLTVFTLGMLTGWLTARESGSELRERLQRAWEDRKASGADTALARQVREDLSQSPRTWHLPQPEVEVVDGKVILSGLVPHASGREEIERLVSTVPGVVDVESHLVIQS